MSKSRVISERSRALVDGISKAVSIASRPFRALVHYYARLLISDFDVYVVGSGVSTSVEKYFESSARAITIAFLTSLVLSYLALSKFLPIAISLVAAALFSLLIVLPLAMAMMIYVPAIMYKSRGETLESKAIHMLTALSLLAASGQTIYDVFESLPKVLGRDYKLFWVEIDLAKSLMATGTPVDQALREVARMTPSPTIRELFLSLSSLASIGAGVVELIHGLTERYVVKHGLRVERSVEVLNVYMEIYVAIALLLPMLTGTFAAVLMLAPTVAGIPFDAFMVLVTLILVPIVSIVVVIMADVVVSRVRP